MNILINGIISNAVTTEYSESKMEIGVLVKIASWKWILGFNSAIYWYRRWYSRQTAKKMAFTVT